MAAPPRRFPAPWRAESMPGGLIPLILRPELQAYAIELSPYSTAAGRSDRWHHRLPEGRRHRSCRCRQYRQRKEIAPLHAHTCLPCMVPAGISRIIASQSVRSASAQPVAAPPATSGLRKRAFPYRTTRLSGSSRRPPDRIDRRLERAWRDEPRHDSYEG
jgi:hypothetical protein